MSGNIRKGEKVTDENQARPEEDAIMRCFLQGAMDEADRQGYSNYSKGRIFVMALRQWEGR